MRRLSELEQDFWADVVRGIVAAEAPRDRFEYEGVWE